MILTEEWHSDSESPSARPTLSQRFKRRWKTLPESGGILILSPDREK
jgi:hypothetical protein